MDEPDRPVRQWSTFADEDEATGGHPILATLIGALLLVMTLAIGVDPAPAPPDDPSSAMAELIGRISGGAALGIVLVWGIAYAATIRKAALGWKIGSLIAITIVATLVSLVRVGIANIAAQENARIDAEETVEIFQQVLEAGDNPPQRIRPGRGPLARMSAVAMNGILADRHAFEREANLLGLPQVVAFEGLTGNSPVLDDCDQLAPLAERARANNARWSRHLAAALAIGEAAARDRQLPASEVGNFARGARESYAGFERQWNLTAQIVVESVPLCRTLARRRWVKQGDQVLFENDRDLAEANSRLTRIQGLIEEQQRNRDAAQDSARETFDRMSSTAGTGIR